MKLTLSSYKVPTFANRCPCITVPNDLDDLNSVISKRRWHVHVDEPGPPPPLLMDEDFQRIEPEVESWYGAELRLLRSANEQVAFYSADNHVCNEDVPQDEFSDVESDDSHHERGLLMPKQIHTSLDPFVALPGGVSEHQRMRVQFCRPQNPCCQHSLTD